jgi:cytochrome c553
MKNRLLGCLPALPLLLAAVAAPARAQPQAAPAGVEACQACHGHDGISKSPAIPNLAGQKADYLVGQLAAFKKGDRKNDFMAAIAGQLSDADMHSFAQYWSGLPAAAPEGRAQAGPGAPVLPSRTALPVNFPTGFTLYDTVDENGTVTERYANAVAMSAVRASQPLPDGSMIVAVNHAERKDASGKVVAGAVTSYSAMESRAGWGAAVPPLLRNGNWDYALFTGDRVRRDTLNPAPCLACHKPLAADSYVFTMKALRAAAAKAPA